MLKELKDIGKYVDSIQSPVESYISIPSGDFNIISLIFDGNDFYFDENIKQGDKDDLIKMCYQPGKGQSVSILPNDYLNLNDDNQIEVSKIPKILNKASEENELLKILNQKYNELNLSEIKNYYKILEQVKNLPKKDNNKKNITNIFTIKVTKDFVIANNFTPIVDKDILYLGEIKEIKELFVSKNEGEEAKLIKGFCYSCEKTKNNIIDFVNSKGVNFPYTFYNIDKKGFTYDLNQNNGYKSFGICKDCFYYVNTGFKFFNSNLNKKFVGTYCYIVPTIKFNDNINNIYDILVENKTQSINSIEKEISDENKTNEGYDDLQLNFGNKENKDILSENNFVKLNFLFGNREQSAFKIDYMLSDVLPSRLGKYYESNKFLKENFNYYIENLFGKDKGGNFNINNNQFKNLLYLNLYPSFKKGEYDWSIKSFFEESYSIGRKDSSLNEYYRFLDKYLNNSYYLSKDFWSLSFKWLREKFIRNYLEQNNGLLFDVWKIYLIHIYLLKNNILDTNIKKMENVYLKSENEKIKYLEKYFKNSDIFDSYDKIYSSLIGLYVKLLLNKQQKEIGSNPFISRIDIDNLDYQGLLKLLNEARAKFNKYAEKKFDYYAELYKVILELSMDKLNKNLSRDEIFYYFNIGMEILPNVYFSNSKEEAGLENESNND